MIAGGDHTAMYGFESGCRRSGVQAGNRA